MKKAIAVTELILIMLAVGAGIGLMFLALKGAEKAGCMGDVEICRNSFAFFKTIKEKEIEAIMTIEPRLDCVAISPPNCAETKLTTTKKTKQAKKDEIMFIIAENLRWCWYKTLGRENQIGEDFAQAFLRGNEVDFCLVCSEFTMPKDVRINANEWTQYLQDKNIPGERKTYEEFIRPVGPQIWGRGYKNKGFEAGKHYFVVSVSAEETEGDNKAYIYISPEVYCGTKDPQIHYQKK